MATDREKYLREYAKQQGLFVEIVPNAHLVETYDCHEKNPELLVYYFDGGIGVTCTYYLAIFYTSSQFTSTAKVVDTKDLLSGFCSISDFKSIVEERIRQRCPQRLAVSEDRIFLGSNYYISDPPEPRDGFRLVEIAELLEEIHPEIQQIPENHPFVYLGADNWSPTVFDVIFTADDAKEMEYSGTDPASRYLLVQDCMVFENGTPAPFYFNASHGNAYANSDASIWKVKQDKVLPQYLMMELCCRYAIWQYESINVHQAHFLFTEKYIYLPEGDDYFSLYEQQRLFVKARTEAIQTFAMKYGVSMEGDGQLSASHFLQGGKYQIIEHIDNGGFGKVYHAIEKGRGAKQDVALKELFVREYCRRKDFSEMITVAPANEKDYERQKSKFVDEYNILQKVGQRTSYVPKLMSTVFSENNTLYYAMQYFDNGTLWHHCQEKDIDAQDKLRIVCQAGIALHHAHDLNYLHLDVTPVNIMLDSQGYGVLIDFGNSTSIANAAHTRCFAPPELMQQVVGQYSMEMDVYSLALTLFTALTGKVPECQTANGNFGKNIDKHLKEASVAECIRQAIGKAVKYNAEDRYQTVRDFLLALLPAITDEQLRGEIEKLTCVTGFMASTHKINPTDGQHSDFIPLSE